MGSRRHRMQQQISWARMTWAELLHVDLHWIYAHIVDRLGHRTSASLRLFDSYSCEFGFVFQWWLLSSSFQCGYVAFDLFSPFPSRTLPRSTRTMTESSQLRLSILLLGNHADFLLSQSTSALSTQWAALVLWLLLEEKETSTNRQNWKFLRTRSSIGQSPSPCLCSGGPRPVRSGWQRHDFLNNRKYRYRPHTQADVGDCSPCRPSTHDRTISYKCLMIGREPWNSELRAYSCVCYDILYIKFCIVNWSCAVTVSVCLYFQTLTSAVKELILVTQPPHVPTLRGHMNAPATLVTMEMEQNVKVRSVPYFCNLNRIKRFNGEAMEAAPPRFQASS